MSKKTEIQVGMDVPVRAGSYWKVMEILPDDKYLLRYRRTLGVQALGNDPEIGEEVEVGRGIYRVMGIYSTSRWIVIDITTKKILSGDEIREKMAEAHADSVVNTIGARTESLMKDQARLQYMPTNTK